MLCKLTQFGTDLSIHINPALVRYIRPRGDGPTVIAFDKEHRIVVSEGVENVASMLKLR